MTARILPLGLLWLACSLSAAHWPQWRGPGLNGVSADGTPPLEWSSQKNILWKERVPGFGTSSPVIWGNRLFITTAVPTDRRPEGSRFPVQQYITLCYDRNTGKVLWQQVSKEEAPHEAHHRDHGYASASVVTDGTHVIAYFGSRGLFCYDLEGTLQWETDFGDMRTRNEFGEGSSPALHKNTVLVCWDHEGDSHLYALDKTTGKQLWKVPRPEPSGWATPLVVEHQGVPQAIINATGKVRSYEIATGKVLWECAGQTANAIPSPVHDGKTVFVTSGFRGSALYAIRLGGTGDLEGTDWVLWKQNRGTPYVPSPLLYGDYLYTISVNAGILSCFNPANGQPHYSMERLPEINGVYASPVGAAGRLYIVGRNGTTVVLKNGPKLEVLAVNKLGEPMDASPAVIGNRLYLRGHQHLYCIGEQ